MLEKKFREDASEIEIDAKFKAELKNRILREAKLKQKNNTASRVFKYPSYLKVASVLVVIALSGSAGAIINGQVAKESAKNVIKTEKNYVSNETTSLTSSQNKGSVATNFKPEIGSLILFKDSSNTQSNDKKTGKETSSNIDTNNNNNNSSSNNLGQGALDKNSSGQNSNTNNNTPKTNITPKASDVNLNINSGSQVAISEVKTADKNPQDTQTTISDKETPKVEEVIPHVGVSVSGNKNYGASGVSILREVLNVTSIEFVTETPKEYVSMYASVDASVNASLDASVLEGKTKSKIVVTRQSLSVYLEEIGAGKQYLVNKATTDNADKLNLNFEKLFGEKSKYTFINAFYSESKKDFYLLGVNEESKKSELIDFKIK